MAITNRLCAAHFHGLRRTLSRRLRFRQRAALCGRTDGEGPASLGCTSSFGTCGLTRLDHVVSMQTNEMFEYNSVTELLANRVLCWKTVA